MSQSANASRVPITANKVRQVCNSAHNCLVDREVDSYRSPLWFSCSCLHHPKLYPHPYLQEIPCGRLLAALCCRMPLCRYRFSVLHAAKPICSTSGYPSWSAEWLGIRYPRKDSRDFKRRERWILRLVVGHFPSQIGLSTVLSPAHFALTGPKHMVVVFYYVYRYCWFSLRGR